MWAADPAVNEWLRNGKGCRATHSIYFREPEESAGKIILVVGAEVSGVNIVVQCSGHAKKVFITVVVSAFHPCSLEMVRRFPI